MADVRTHFLICTGGGCIASGALERERGRPGRAQGPRPRRRGRGHRDRLPRTLRPGPGRPRVPGRRLLPEASSVDDVPEIVEEHLLKGRVVERLVSHAPGTDKTQAEMNDIPFFNRQVKIVLRNCGIIDPLKIDEYIARDGYQALAKVLTSMTPEAVVDEVLASGLRGRGGAGFPTGMKWRFAQQQDDETKYILCNADEGDPGAFMDRSVLEGDPHSLIEGMIIAAYAIGAHQGYVYVRAEYPLAVERLEHAIEQAREYGLLGKNIMGSGFDFDLEIRMGSGAFVCGEETALMTSIEGNRGEPRPRPPFPAVTGLWGKPSVLNNVETYANIAPIILKGAAWYASTGTEKSKGTKVFALAGNVQQHRPRRGADRHAARRAHLRHRRRHPGRQGVQGRADRRPVGRLHPQAAPQRPGRLRHAAGARRHHGLGRPDRHGRGHLHGRHRPVLPGVHPGRELRQVPALPRRHQAHAGDPRAHPRGEGEEGDIERLIDLGETIRETALCGLGQTAANPVLSTIRHFRHEYEAHIRDQYCEAGVCPSMFMARCSNACPASVNIPGFVSLVGEKRYDEALRLHRERNPLASICARVCFHPCESKCLRASLDGALAIRGVKRFMVEQETDVAAARDPGERRERGAQGRRRRRRPGRPLGRLLPGPPGLQAGRVRGRAKAGGMLVQAIPAYRLPRDELAREVSMIETMGVHVRVRQGARPRLHPAEPQGRGLRGRVRRRRRPAGHEDRHARRGRPRRLRRPVLPQAVQRARHRRRWARTWPSSAAATRPSTPPAPPCASAPRRSRSSTAARARRCPPGARRSTTPTTRASRS